MATKEAKKPSQAPTKPAEAPTKPAVVEKAAAAPAKIIQHGITKPGSGKTLQVWDIADKLSAKLKSPVGRKALLEATEAADINAATAATQYGKWRTFHGLGKEAVAEDKPVETTKAKVTKKQAPVEVEPETAGEEETETETDGEEETDEDAE